MNHVQRFSDEDLFPRGERQKAVLVETWTEYLRRFKWQIYMVPTFAYNATVEYAHRTAVKFIETLGPLVYGAVFSGPGKEEGHANAHLLLGGLWQAGAPADSAPTIAERTRRLQQRWQERNGFVKKIELFDPSRFSTYLADHHQIELVGSLQRHRPRGHRGRGTSHASSLT